jgi:hypothetical protein
MALRYCGVRRKLGRVRPWLRPRPVQVLGGSDVQRVWRVACGALHTVALTVSGDVYAWGDNDSGVLGNGGTTYEDLPRLLGCSDATGLYGASSALGHGISGEYVTFIAASGWCVIARSATAAAAWT